MSKYTLDSMRSLPAVEDRMYYDLIMGHKNVHKCHVRKLFQGIYMYQLSLLLWDMHRNQSAKRRVRYIAAEMCLNDLEHM